MDKLLSFLGICKKAGKLSLGYDSTVEMLKKGKCRLVLVTNDLSSNSLSKIILKADEYDTELLHISISMGEIMAALGQRSGIISINDSGFKSSIRALLKN